MEDESPGKSIGRSLTSLSLWKSDTFNLERTDTMITIGKLKLRGKTDDLPQDWWVASTAIPLLAATIGPLANVLSIAALVTKWRVTLPDNGTLPLGTDDAGIDIPDPHWEIVFNAISLACGFFGNFCLLLNFTRRVRYIVALPMTIIAWYFATGILIAIVVAMNEHDAPIRPGQTYSQGFWHALIAAILYLIGSMILMVNMLGYFLGHYPQHFDLDDDQRTLILQTMMFFFWLAGGAGVFSAVCGMTYADALYFCDVTVLTIGFGDFVATNTAGRGIILPYSVIGIIFLGLMINSIRKFAASMSKDKVIKKHQLNMRAQTFGRSVTSEKELRDRLGLPPRRESDGRRPSGIRKPSLATAMKNRRGSLEQYGHFDVHGRTITFHEHKSKGGGGRGGAGRNHKSQPPLSRDAKMQMRKAQKSTHSKHASRREKLLLLREEKDRFDAMREIQANTSKFKQYYALSMSALAFGILWCVGAVVFWCAEARIQQLTYFEALYFCYVSLLTIGYGDFSPRSNAGKPFFVVWSLVAIPTMTILISDMGDTVVSAINRGTFTLADWTVMPKAGVWHDFLENHPKLKDWLARKTKEHEEKKRIQQGFAIQNPDEEAAVETADENEVLPAGNTLEKLAEEPLELTEHDLARKLAIAIKRTANDLRLEHAKKYSYEEWVEFTRLIRFSSLKPDEVEEEEEEEGLVEWDWIGEDSPMLADISESEWVLDRLCESLNRYTRKQGRKANHKPHVTIAHPDEITPQISNHGNEHYQDQHISIYPAHPGPRHANEHKDPPIRDLLGRPVKPPLARASRSEPLPSPRPEASKSESSISGVEDEDEPEELRSKRAVVFVSDESGEGSGSGSGESGTAAGSRNRGTSSAEPLNSALDTAEVRDWATKVDSRGQRFHDREEAQQWDLRHLGGG